LCEGSLDAIGPLARDIDLLERAARVIGDFDEGDPIAAPAAVAGLGGVEVVPAVAEAYARARSAMGTVAEIELPHPLSRARLAGFMLTGRSLSAALADADPALLSDRLKRLIAYGPRRKAADWAEDRRVLSETATAFRSAVERHGALLLPTSPAPAFPHSEQAPANQADFTAPANFADLPAISIPGGWSEGLPFGMQLVGRPGHEGALFALARRLDAALHAYRAPAHTAINQGENPCVSSACST
jgi:aspartyl-tRNA(Asn)/glutamyl-tRNA(Gln) amidotransferase subunit A